MMSIPAMAQPTPPQLEGYSPALQRMLVSFISELREDQARRFWCIVRELADEFAGAALADDERRWEKLLQELPVLLTTWRSNSDVGMRPPAA